MVKSLLLNFLKNLGPSLKKNYIIFESDDWGSLRMPSNDVYAQLESKGIQLKFPGSDQYNLYDTLEDADDLERLFDVLSSSKDSHGRHAKFTPLVLAANPDFEKIKDSDFQNYSYLNLSQSYAKYNKGNVLPLINEGIKNELFLPQFHGREHLNVPVWLRALQNNVGDSRLAFDYGVWGHINSHPRNIYYQAAFDVEFPADVDIHKDVIIDGLNLFETTFGYRASYFVPPNGPMNNSLLPVLTEHGIQLVSSDTIQVEVFGEGKSKKHFRYMGMKNKFGQRIIKRNCFFEPSAGEKDWVDSCLRDIDFAFKHHKPAVISTHRVNYIGGLNLANRDHGLNQLKDLLSKITKHWPEAEFIHTSELFDLFNKN